MSNHHWLSRLLARLGQVAAVTVLLGILGYPLLHGHFVGSVSPWLGYAAITLGFGLGLLLFTWRSGLRSFLDGLSRLSERRYLILLVVLCFAAHFVALRIIDSLPGEKAPDPFGSWLFFKASAMYPPGHDFLTKAVRFILGDSSLTTILFTSAMVTFASWLVYRVAGMAYGEAAGRLAGLVLALYPAWLIYGNFEYDLLLGTLLLLLVYLFFVRPPQSHRFWYLAVFGLILGFTCLVKPIATIFPLAALIIYLASNLSFGQAVKRTVTLGAFMLLAIAPWTVRNYILMDHFVLVSTNSGIVLHTSNNPDSDGREMTSPLMRPLPGDTDEVEKDRRHLRQAFEWIVHNPMQFLKLTGYRVTWTWGSDTTFVDSNSVLHGKLSPGAMNAVKGVVQVAYLALVIVWGVGLILYRRAILASTLPLVILSPIVYIWMLHLVCQAHGQHHLPVMPFVIILASGTLVLRAGLALGGRPPDAALMEGH